MKIHAFVVVLWLASVGLSQQRPQLRVSGYPMLDGSRVYAVGQRIQVDEPHGAHGGWIVMDDAYFVRPISIAETRRQEEPEFLAEGSLVADVRPATTSSWLRKSFKFQCTQPEPQVGETTLALHHDGGGLRIGEFAGHCELKSTEVVSQPALSSIQQSPRHIFVEPWRTLARETATVDAGASVHYNFDVPAETKILMEFQVNGGLNDQIRAFLVDAPNYQLYSGNRPFKQYSGDSGTVRGIGKLEVRVPQAGTYYLVLDNRKALLFRRNVTVHVDAILPQTTSESEQLGTALENQYSALKKIFIFPDFQTSVRHCGAVNAFSNPNITICVELLEEMMSKGMVGAVTFAYLHELGHTLMKQWGLPLWDNEDAADEFATAFLLIGKQDAMALQAAQYWESQSTTTQDAVAKIWMDDRHSLSPQRARNIVHWVKDRDEIETRWERVFIPNMQTSILQNMLHDSTVSDKSLVRSELKRRSIPVPEP